MSSERQRSETASNASSVRRHGVRIGEVARHAGVSIATVSRALSMPGRVSPATRARVLQVVDALGYRPSVAGRHLRAARSMMVLVVIRTSVTPFFSQLLLRIEIALAQRGYGLLIGGQHGEADEQRLVDLVLAGQADGILLLTNHVPDAFAGDSRKPLGVPVVAVSTLPGPSVPGVFADGRGGGALVAEHFLELGHREFAYVAGPVGPVDDDRWEGFSTRLADAGVPIERIGRYRGDFEIPSGYRAGKAFDARKDPATAVFAVSDMMAIGFVRALRDAGRIIPDDVAVAGFDGIELAQFVDPTLTTVCQPSEELGQRAVELLLRLLQDGELEAGERSIRLPVSLRIGGSTRSRSRQRPV